MFQFPAFATLPLCIQGKLPIIDTWKPQQQQRNLEELIAAYHVLHRLCMPRHPPIALKTLDRSHCQCPPAQFRRNCRFSQTLASLASAQSEGLSPGSNPVRDLIRCHWHKKTSFSRSVRGRG